MSWATTPGPTILTRCEAIGFPKSRPGLLLRPPWGAHPVGAPGDRVRVRLQILAEERCPLGEPICRAHLLRHLVPGRDDDRDPQRPRRVEREELEELDHLHLGRRLPRLPRARRLA